MDGDGGTTSAGPTDHSDLLEEDDEPTEVSEDVEAVGNLGAASAGLAGLAGLAEAGEDGGDPFGLDGGALDPEKFREALGGVTAGLAEQLTSITEEMSKIRGELYGDNGIGGIAKELEKLKAGGLGGLLDKDSLQDMLGGMEGLADDLGRGSSSRSGGSSGSSTSAKRRADGGASSGEARRRGGDREAELEGLRKRLEEQRRARDKTTRDSNEGAVSFGEKMMLLCLVLVCLFVGSPFFRSSVRRAAGMLLWGETSEDDPQDEVEFGY